MLGAHVKLIKFFFSIRLPFDVGSFVGWFLTRKQNYVWRSDGKFYAEIGLIDQRKLTIWKETFKNNTPSYVDSQFASCLLGHREIFPMLSTWFQFMCLKVVLYVKELLVIK